MALIVSQRKSPSRSFVLLCASLLGFAVGCGSIAIPGITPRTAAPQITTQPVSQTAIGGGIAAFSVSATGNGSLSYQWMKDGNAVSGGTSSTLTLNPVLVADGGSYTAVVTNTLNKAIASTTSNAATLTVGGNDRTPLLGAIRWDAWTGSANVVGAQVEKTLSPNIYHYRVPFFGVEVNASSVTIDGTKQQIMDQEIEYAHHAGLSYWAFLWYPPATGLDQARKLYYTSAKKNLMDYCLIVESDRFNTEVSLDQIAAEFKDPSYVKVMGKRPLLYLLGYKAIKAADIDALRSKSVAAGTGNPYIVEMRFDSNYAVLDKLHLDAFSMYCTPSIKGGAPYAKLAAADVDQWNSVGIGQARKIVPHVTSGWDKRTRYDNRVTWDYSPSYKDMWVVMPTPVELSNHVKDAMDWVTGHRNIAEANTVLIYAWNEHDEGGFLCPTLSKYQGTARIDAIRKMLGLAP